MRRLAPFFLAIPLLMLAACGAHDEDDHGHAHGDGDAHEEGHEHAEGPNGGQILDVGNESAHFEVMIDHAKHAVVVHVLDTSNAPLLIKDAPTFAFGEGAAKKTVTATAVGAKDGRASEWHFADEAFGEEIEGGDFTLKLGAKTHAFAWEHDDDHEHDEHEDDDHHEDGDHHEDEEHEGDDHHKDGEDTDG